MSYLDRSACARSVIKATPYNHMFLSWIFNILVNLRKIISLEPHMNLDSLVNEVFLYQNKYFLMQKLSAAAAIAAAKKFSKRRQNFVN